MKDENSSNPIPDGWEFKTEHLKDGSETSYYWCPRSGQHFFTYEDLLRYVKYAKEAQFSIYSPDFHSMKLRKKANWFPRTNKPSFAARRRNFLGESSKTVPSNRVTSPKESTNLEERTTLSDSEDITDTGRNMEAGQTGVEANKEPDISSSDLEALEIGVENFEAFANGNLDEFNFLY